jgi:hypothetical protein
MTVDESIVRMPVSFPRNLHTTLRQEALNQNTSASALTVQAVKEKLTHSDKWCADWEAAGRDRDGNLILKYTPTGGLYHVIPEEDL